MNMPKSRDIQAKMSSPKVILSTFWLVTVKVLNSYEKSNKMHTDGVNRKMQEDKKGRRS